nr:hypothetical protein [Tanacetum cinerariifolium]
ALQVTGTGRRLFLMIGNPPIKASICFSKFGTMFGNESANSWNLLISSTVLFVKSLFNSVQVILLACSIPIGWAYAFHQDKASLFSSDIVDIIGDEDPTDEDGDIEVLVSLGEISSEGKNSWESDIGDCDNTRDEGSYEHYKSVGSEVELLESGFELQGSKMVEMGQFG